MIAALDIGGTKIAAGLVERTGRVVCNDQCPTDSTKGFEDGVHRIAAMLRRLQSECARSIEGIGIGCTGPVHPTTGTIGEAELLRGWWGAPIVDRLSQELGVPAVMENDADAVALSESRWGAGHGAECLVYVSVGTGIGGGVVRHGELYRGAGGAHPEIGHIAIDVSSGTRCYCGLTGCWESLASGPAIEAWYADGAPAAEICRRARGGEPRARQAVARLARYIGIGVASTITAYCPDVLLLGGGVLRDAALFLDEVRQLVREYATQVPVANLRIDVVEPGRHAALQGAAAVWLHRYGKETEWST